MKNKPKRERRKPKTLKQSKPKLSKALKKLNKIRLRKLGNKPEIFYWGYGRPGLDWFDWRFYDIK